MKKNNLIRKEVWLTLEECNILSKVADKIGSTPKRLLESYIGFGLEGEGCVTMRDRVAAKIIAGNNAGKRKSPVLNPKKKKLRKVKKVLVHAKGSTEIEGQTVLPL